MYSPSQISLACLRMANCSLIDDFLDWQYQEAPVPRDWIVGILDKIESEIHPVADGPDLKKVKDIDKRLKSCTNPEKVPGTAL